MQHNQDSGQPSSHVDAMRTASRVDTHCARAALRSEVGTGRLTVKRNLHATMRVQAGVDDIECAANRDEGYDPDDAAFIAALGRVRTELAERHTNCADQIIVDY